MNPRTDAEHAYFTRVPSKLLADLRSVSGPALTFIEADGRLHLNEAAVANLPTRDRHSVKAPVVVPPILFIPGGPAGRELRGA